MTTVAGFISVAGLLTDSWKNLPVGSAATETLFNVKENIDRRIARNKPDDAYYQILIEQSDALEKKINRKIARDFYIRHRNRREILQDPMSLSIALMIAGMTLMGLFSCFSDGTAEILSQLERFFYSASCLAGIGMLLVAVIQTMIDFRQFDALYRASDSSRDISEQIMPRTLSFGGWGVVSPGLMAAGMMYMNLSVILRLCDFIDLVTGQWIRGIGMLLCLLSIMLLLPWVAVSARQKYWDGLNSVA